MIVMIKTDKKLSEGHYLSQGIAIGIPLGIPIGLALGNIAIGPAIGVVIGTGLGAVWENKAKKEGRIRKLTQKEKTVKQKDLKYVLILGLIVFLAVLLGFFFSR